MLNTLVIPIVNTRVDDIAILHRTRLFTYSALYIHVHLLHRDLLDYTLMCIHSEHRDLHILSHGTLLSHVHVSPLL